MTMTRQELFDGIWTRTVQGFADEKGLNYVTLHKLLNAENIPKPGRHDNALIRQGKEGLKLVERPVLPGDRKRRVKVPVRRDRKPKKETPEPKRRGRKSGIPTETQEEAQKKVDRMMNERKAEEAPHEKLLPRIKDNPRWNTLYFLAPTKRQRVIQEAEHIHVRSDGLYHPLPRRYQQEIMAWVAQKKAAGDEASVQKIPPLPGNWDEVSIENYSRIFLMLDAVYTSLELLGEEILPDGAVLVSGQKVVLKFTEGRTRVYREPTAEEALNGAGPRPEFRPNGKLTLSIGMLYSVKDSKKEHLENRLGDVLELIYTIAFQLSSEQASDRDAARKQNRSYAREYDRVEDLLQQARDYEDAVRIRALVRGVQHRLAQGEMPYSDYWGEWAAWASRKAEWLDPTIGFADPVLGRRHDPILQPSKDEMT